VSEKDVNIWSKRIKKSTLAKNMVMDVSATTVAFHSKDDVQLVTIVGQKKSVSSRDRTHDL